jgi:DNA-binding transcriptional MerR regulator
MTGTCETIRAVASEYLTTGVAAAEVGVVPNTLLAWMAKGIVTPAMRTAGGHYRWVLADLRRQLAEHEASRVAHQQGTRGRAGASRL